MRIALKIILSTLLFCSVSSGFAEIAAPAWFSLDKNKQVKLRVELFLSSVCPHCKKADEFFRTLEAKESWIEVHRYIINEDKVALEFFNQRLQQQHVDSFAMPAIFFCDSRWVGFDSAENSGKVLLRALNYCHQQIVAADQLTPLTRTLLKQWATASWYDMSIEYKPSPALFIPMMALTDALNPCAAFCIMALFAFLWLTPTQLAQFTRGIAFIVAVGLVHFFQQAYTAAFYHTWTWLSIFSALLGLGLLAYVGSNYFKVKTEKPIYITGILVVLTAMVIQAYQQTCTPSFALVFEQWLAAQPVSPTRLALYQLGYQLIYLVPLLVLIIVFSFLSHSKSLEKRRLVITQVSWMILTIIGCFFIFYPKGLSSLWISFVALAVAILLGWLTAKRSA
ncbi:glutaredoxin family protein [Legionella feeleii]|uniref:Thioredoxin domain-containing protein n=1 Tax=Legionella feeleii TaxID=453 RepID=A0A0W0U1A6_9GAMM|nr:hypothetical protein [Legionella feeleii]KTD01452.1 hypothetical protein Lfee_1056 [Legionella feeleii]SPX61261.1 Uncharacterised protein [Legionella feeleii]